MNRIFIMLMAACMLAGCYKDAEETRPAGNGYEVERLFTHDGCTVYRFMDSNYRYFARCENATASTSTRNNCGKSCTRETTITTGPQQ